MNQWMTEHERKTWIELLRHCREEKEWGRDLCRFAGMITAFEPVPYCPRCILAPFVMENRKELEKEAGDFLGPWFRPEQVEKNAADMEEFGFFIMPVCLMMDMVWESWRHPETFNSDSPSAGKLKGEKESVVYWAGRVAKWLEKGAKPRRRGQASRGKSSARSKSALNPGKQKRRKG